MINVSKGTGTHPHAHTHCLPWQRVNRRVLWLRAGANLLRIICNHSSWETKKKKKKTRLKILVRKWFSPSLDWMDNIPLRKCPSRSGVVWMHYGFYLYFNWKWCNWSHLQFATINACCQHRSPTPTPSPPQLFTSWWWERQSWGFVKDVSLCLGEFLLCLKCLRSRFLLR